MNKRIHIAVYLFLSIFILRFILSGGYVILLDLPFSPDFISKRSYDLFYGFAQPEYGGSLVFLLILKPLISIMGAQFIEKLILISILFFSGLNAHNLVNFRSHAPCYFAGFIYMINPFVYVRFLAGQWLILLAYAAMPYAVKSFIDFMERQSAPAFLKAVLSLTLVGMFNAHILFLTLLVTFVIFIFKVFRTKDIRLIKWFFALSVFLMLLNSYWILPLVASQNRLLDQITQSDVYSFYPTVASFNVIFTIASMYGFWRPGYLYAKDMLPFWQFFFIFILFLASVGFLSNRGKKDGTYIKSMAAAAVISVMLGAGAAGLYSPLYNFLFDNLLIFRGMRDSHKFVALLVLAYAYLGAFGVMELQKNLHKPGWKRFAAAALMVLALATPFIYSFTFLNGFAGQIKTTDYPDDWYGTNEFLNQDGQDFKVLFFPWHMYMNFHWVPGNDKRIANPAQYFFDKDVISGKNIEIGDIYSEVNSPEQIYIDSLLQKENITNFGWLISPLGIKYVLLTREADYKKYFFLFNQSDLELVKKTENFYVFMNKREVARIYGTDSMDYIKGRDELQEKSWKFPDYVKKSPVNYELKQKPLDNYIIFTESYSEGWEFDGKKPVVAYGVANAYETNNTNGREIRYERFYNIYYPSYILSFMALIALFVAVFHRKISDLIGHIFNSCRQA